MSAAAAPTRIAIETLDHLVLTVRDLDATVEFYCDVLGMRFEEQNGRASLHFGTQKLNLHVVGAEIQPNAQEAGPGTADLCFITAVPVEAVVRACEDADIAIEVGPVERVGATGPLLSVYLRDPDGNLVELANRIEA